MSFWCKIFGHKYNDIDIIMAEIKVKSLNQIVPKLICIRCGIDLIADKLKEKE